MLKEMAQIEKELKSIEDDVMLKKMNRAQERIKITIEGTAEGTASFVRALQTKQKLDVQSLNELTQRFRNLAEKYQCSPDILKEFDGILSTLNN